MRIVTSFKSVVIFLGFCVAVPQGAASQNVKEYPQPPQMTPQMTEFWTPQPTVVTPAPYRDATPAPSDAIVLLGESTDLSSWQHDNGSAVKWNIEPKGVLTVKPGTGQIRTKELFGDCQLHLEWSAPTLVKGESQGRGNSGVFLQGIYEVQILDNYQNETYIHGQAGSIYKQSAPLVNPIRKPGEWNTYDIIYTAPRFKTDGTLHTHGRITVLFNGVLVQNNTLILGSTEYIGWPQVKAHGDGPVILQDHGDLVRFRNIWLRKL